MSRPARRKQVAAQWLSDVVNGPAFLQELSEKQREQYRLWSRTWIIAPIKKLLPDLFSTPGPD